MVSLSCLFSYSSLLWAIVKDSCFCVCLIVSLFRLSVVRLRSCFFSLQTLSVLYSNAQYDANHLLFPTVETENEVDIGQPATPFKPYEEPCSEALANCRAIRCPYGVER